MLHLLSNFFKYLQELNFHIREIDVHTPLPTSTERLVVLYDWKFGRSVKNKATPGDLRTMYYCARHACIATVKKLLKLAFTEALSLDKSLGVREGNKREHEFLGMFP